MIRQSNSLVFVLFVHYISPFNINFTVVTIGFNLGIIRRYGTPYVPSPSILWNVRSTKGDTIINSSTFAPSFGSSFLTTMLTPVTVPSSPKPSGTVTLISSMAKVSFLLLIFSPFQTLILVFFVLISMGSVSPAYSSRIALITSPVTSLIFPLMIYFLNFAEVFSVIRSNAAIIFLASETSGDPGPINPPFPSLRSLRYLATSLVISVIVNIKSSEILSSRFPFITLVTKSIAERSFTSSVLTTSRTCKAAFLYNLSFYSYGTSRESIK